MMINTNLKSTVTSSKVWWSPGLAARPELYGWFSYFVVLLVVSFTGHVVSSFHHTVVSVVKTARARDRTNMLSD